MQQAPARPRPPKVLIVDDDEDILSIEEALLRGEGYEVVSAMTAKEALKRVAAERPDLMLLDVQLPDGLGTDVCKQVKEQHPDLFLPIILVTGLSQSQDKLKGLRSGADDYVTKPFDDQELKARIKVMLRLKSAQDKIMQYLNVEKELLEEMAQKNESLAEANAMKDLFLAIASHDLMTPLQVAQTSCERMLFGPTASSLSNEQLEYLYRIQSSVFYMSSIVRDLLDREVRMHSMPIQLRTDNLGAILQECVECHRMFATDKSLAIEEDIPIDLPLIELDPIRIREVFNNLIENAINFTPNGGRIAVRARRERDAVVVEIHDSGPGLSKEELPNVFLPYKRLINRIGQKGFGLGLYIVKEIVLLHGAEIEVDSELGKGTLFRLRFRRETQMVTGLPDAEPLFTNKTPLIMFGEIAVDKGYAKREDILICLDIQQKEMKLGKRRLIGEILLERKVITAEQLAAILQELLAQKGQAGPEAGDSDLSQ